MAVNGQAPDPAANQDLRGHDAAIGTLEQALASGRMHHGWLFHGRRGIGKATLAFRFARALLAGQSRPGLALDPDHPVVTQVAGRHHPDLVVIEAERDAKTGKAKAAIPVDRVRDATARLHSTAAISERRVLIVDGAEKLNRNAANALLKPLEEPPTGAILILVSHRPGQVAATLRSRTAKLPMQALDRQTLSDLLTSHMPDLDAGAREPIIAMANGSLGRALELAGAQWLETYQSVLRAVAAEPPDALALDDLAGVLARQSAKEGFPKVMDLIQTVFGRITASATGRTGPPLFSDEQAMIERLAARQRLDRWAVLWEKVARLAAAVDGLNLDHAQALTQILSAMARPPEAALPFVQPTSSLGGGLPGASPLLGDDHAVG